jgi:3',5'-cyclic AMP phosphodiesterase CpdA
MDPAQAQTQAPLFLQISDTHIGFNRPANPDVAGTLRQALDKVSALPRPPALILHTGDVTHLSRAAEFDTANQLLSQMKGELHVVPGEHDVTDGPGAEFFARFGKPSGNRGYYSFDAQGVHFIALVNVMNFKPNGLGALGDDQLSWLKDDLAGRSASQPIVVFAHMPLWTIYQPWGWGTAEGEQIAEMLRRFGSVTVLNGHIHQIVQKVEGNIHFHTARSTAYPQPQAGNGPGPGPLLVPPAELPGMLGVTMAARAMPLALTDSTLA